MRHQTTQRRCFLSPMPGKQDGVSQFIQSFPVRDVLSMRQWLKQYHDASSVTSKKEIAQRYGLKPPRTNHENPFYLLYDLYKFDIYTDSPVDFFHISLIGLFPTTIALINSKLSSSKVNEIQGHMNDLGVSNLKWSDNAYWNGDMWLRFYSIAPFIYDRLLSIQDDFECGLLVCLFRLCNWMRLMLLERLTSQDIDHAENEWRVWAKQMIELFPGDNLNLKPNFHNMTHVFAFARDWGPPILYWARPFEHRHKMFKRLISEGNFKNVLVWSAQQDSIHQSIRFVYPEFNRNDRKMHKAIGLGKLVHFWEEGKLCYGEVQEHTPNHIIVTLISFQNVHRGHRCPIWDSRRKGNRCIVLWRNYIGLTPLQGNFVNHFTVLNAL